MAMFASISLSMFIAVIDQTIVATALPAIAAEFGEPKQAAWVMVLYLLAITIASPVYGRLGDAFGRRRLLLAALVVFIIASPVCAAAGSIEMLWAGRVLQGFGAGGLMTLSHALIGESVPLRERGRYQGYIATVVVTASALGPVFGGFMAEHFGWRSIFALSAPMGILAFLLVLRLPARPGSGTTQRFDVLGVVLFGCFVVPVFLAMADLQHPENAAIPRFVALCGVALLALFLLLRQERRAAFPLIPLNLLRQSTVWRSNLMASAHGGTLASLTTFVPLYAIAIGGASIAESGIFLLPSAFGIGLGSIMTGRMVSRTGYTTIFPSCGLMLLVLVLLYITWRVPDIGSTELLVALMAAALCMGTVMNVVQVTVLNAGGQKMLGAAAASVQLSRAIGSALGTAITSTVLFAMLARNPAANSLFTSLLEHGPAALTAIPQAKAGELHLAIGQAFRGVFMSMAAFCALGAVMAWTIPARRI